MQMDQTTRKHIKVLEAVGQTEAAKVLRAIHAGDDEEEGGGETPLPTEPAAEPRPPGTPIPFDEALTMSRGDLDALKQTDRAAWQATMAAISGGRDGAGRRT